MDSWTAGQGEGQAAVRTTHICHMAYSHVGSLIIFPVSPYSVAHAPEFRCVLFLSSVLLRHTSTSKHVRQTLPL